MKIALSFFLLAITYWLMFEKKEIHIYHHTDGISISADVNHCDNCDHNLSARELMRKRIRGY
jgi:hypothetical protein